MLDETGMMGMFLGVVLKFIVFGLFAVSVVMLVNVANINVERRRYELGMRRCIGMPARVLFNEVLEDALRMVLIANLFAYPTSIFLISRTEYLYKRFFGSADSLRPDFQAVLIAIGVGLLAPILSFITPIRDSLKSDIISAIQPIRNRIAGLKH